MLAICVQGDFYIALASFAFVRRVGYYILQLYVPTAMLVVLSWTMFCLNHDHTGDRITIGVTLFLTMMFLHGYANTSLPRVSYVKMVDLFMVVALGEILIITVESIIISKLHERYIHQEEKRNEGMPTLGKMNAVSNSQTVFSYMLIQFIVAGLFYFLDYLFNFQFRI